MAAQPASDCTLSFRTIPLARSGMLGCRRHDLRIGKLPGYVDTARTHLNSTLFIAEGYEAGAERNRFQRVLDKAEQELASRRVKKARTENLWRSAILTFSTEAQALLGDQHPDDRALAVMRGFSDRHGVRLLSVVAHRDETAIHYHALCENIRVDGYALRLPRAELSLEQDHAATYFADLGITRGKRKTQRVADGESPSKTIHRSVRQLHSELPAEIEAKRAELTELEAKLASALERQAIAETKAKAATQRVEKLYRRAEVYERRAQAAKHKIKELQIELARMQAVTSELDQRQNDISKREGALVLAEAKVAAQDSLVASAVALLSGDETPERMVERHQAEVEEDGLTWEQAWEIDGKAAGTPSFWAALRTHVKAWWAARIRDFGFTL